MSNKPDISIIIVTHNSSSLLKSCLNSIYKQTGITIQSIVVDNKSSDDTLAMLANSYPQVTAIPRKTSHGFSRANNEGLKSAKADTILFLNPDTKFQKSDDLKACYDKFIHETNLGAMSCKVVLALSGKIDETAHRGFPTPWAAFTHFSGLERLFPKSKIFSQYLQSYKGYDTQHEVDAVGGMFLMISRSVGDEVGWWDQDYTFYGEDIDLCYRIKLAGYRVLYWPKVTILHYKGASSGISKHSKSFTTASGEKKKQAKLWSIQAMEIFYDKHYLNKYPKIVTIVVKIGIKLLKITRVYFT